MAGQRARRGERLGSNSEVDRFRVERGERSCIERLASGITAHLGNQCRVGQPVGGSDPRVGAALQPVARQIVRTRGAREHFYRYHLGVAVAQQFHVRKEPWLDRVADQVDHALLQVERVAYSADVPGAVLDADQNDTAGGIGKRDDGAKKPGRRGEIPLELQVLALGLAQDLGEFHYSEVYSEAALAATLPSSAAFRSVPQPPRRLGSNSEVDRFRVEFRAVGR